MIESLFISFESKTADVERSFILQNKNDNSVFHIFDHCDQVKGQIEVKFISHCRVITSSTGDLVSLNVIKA